MILTHMPHHIDEKYILPIFTLNRPRFDFRQIDVAPRQHGQNFIECTRPIAGADQQRGAVIAAVWGRLASDNEKTGGIAAIILYAFHYYL
jgi:hypothetical protein